jgi:hypothetical protein
VQAAHTIELVLSWAVTTTLLFVVVVTDERRLPPERLARAWPATSRDAAIVAFGILALPIHFMRTRGHFGGLRGVLGILKGLVMGVAGVAIVTLINAAVLTAFAFAAGLPLED